VPLLPMHGTVSARIWGAVAAVPLLPMYGTVSARIWGAVAAVPLLPMYGAACARIWEGSRGGAAAADVRHGQRPYLGAVAAVSLLQHAISLLRTNLAGGHKKRQVFQTGAFNVIAFDSWNLTMHRNSD